MIHLARRRRRQLFHARGKDVVDIGYVACSELADEETAKPGDRSLIIEDAKGKSVDVIGVDLHHVVEDKVAHDHERRFAHALHK